MPDPLTLARSVLAAPDYLMQPFCRLCFELSHILLYGSAQFQCVLHFSRKNSFPWNVGPPFPAVRLFSRSVEATIGQEL